MPCFVCHNLGTFKKYIDIGLTSYRNLRLAPVKILGYFVRTMFFAAKNPHGLIFLIKIFGFMKSAKILGLHCITIPGLTPVEILGYFLRTRLLTPKTHCLYGLSKSWVFKEYQDIGPTLNLNPSLTPVTILGYFIRIMFLRPKTNGLFCSSKSWDF